MNKEIKENNISKISKSPRSEVHIDDFFSIKQTIPLMLFSFSFYLITS